MLISNLPLACIEVEVTAFERYRPEWGETYWLGPCGPSSSASSASEGMQMGHLRELLAPLGRCKIAVQGAGDFVCEEGRNRMSETERLMDTIEWLLKMKNGR
jgi:hypothetical protein